MLLEYEKVNNTNRLWKTIEHCKRARKYQKEKLNNISRQLGVLIYNLKRYYDLKTLGLVNEQNLV